VPITLSRGFYLKHLAVFISSISLFLSQASRCFYLKHLAVFTSSISLFLSQASRCFYLKHLAVFTSSISLLLSQASRCFYHKRKLSCLKLQILVLTFKQLNFLLYSVTQLNFSYLKIKFYVSHLIKGLPIISFTLLILQRENLKNIAEDFLQK
jgi:hypothetical protein